MDSSVYESPCRRDKRLTRSRMLLLGAVVFAFGAATDVHAKKNSAVIFRAAGSGALLGVGAGLISYPFAKSKNTIVAGAVVGALLGTVYGYYLVESRDQDYLNSSLEPRRDRPSFTDASLLARTRSPHDGRSVGLASEWMIPFPALRFDLR